ncbi:MAG TPA: SDR family oxidoreductase [Chloroflexota bacterium]|jgi:NADP-dependent 3-hydroxy acid dehydrogenase YdfG|nr:SDR family oxidoreductase [Chloroflexota bacterium]
MGQLDGKTALVTGASSGLGRATARLFAEEGADVALVARRELELRTLADELARLGRRVLVCRLDLSDRAAALPALADAVAALGRIDVAVHAAATNVPRRALNVLDPADWDMMVATNLTAAYNLTHALLPSMRAAGGGLIVYVSTGAVRQPDRSGVGYQATKHGLVGLAHGAMQEEKEHGLRTTVLFPGLMDTPFVLKRPTPTPPEVMAKALKPEDVARACLFVASLPARAHVPELVILPAGL